ncbi:MAG: Sialidase B precursor [bacterium ADurb.Bin429]|nr:MAG: Sialidase B precursor [bacterium ADurb.Bin429]
MTSQIVLPLPHGPGNPRNSEGAFAALRDGRIVYVYTRYYGDDWADHATARLCARYSSDGGCTWTTDDVVVLENEGRCNVMSVSLLRLRDGRLGLWYIRKDGIDNAHTWMRASEDDGATWSAPICCVPAPGYFVVNNDRVVQLSSGRLVVPAAYHRNSLASDTGTENLFASLDLRGIALFFLSDDGGATWRESRDWWALPVRSGSGLQEPGVVELCDGRLYACCRTDVGRQYEMFSEDGGDTWTPPQPSAFQGPCAPLSIKRLPTGDLLAVWNDHSGRLTPVPTEAGWSSTSWGRTPLVCALSRDDGATWERHKLLEDDPTHGYCYTAIHPTDDAVLLAYCCGGGDSGVLQDSRIRRVTYNWLYG